MSKKINQISNKTKRLLNKGETFKVEYKQSVDGLDTETIVSFANSDEGGTVLVGVEEYKDNSGLQKGKVIGCNIGDREELKIKNRAEECKPSISLEIITENIKKKKPIFRVEIPSGANKPYCTSSGKYKIRGDGKKETLYPKRLLSLFLEEESDTFINRFKQSTEKLEDDLNEMKSKIEKETENILKNIKYMRMNIDTELNKIKDHTMDVASFSEDSTYGTQDILGELNELKERIFNIENIILTKYKE